MKGEHAQLRCRALLGQVLPWPSKPWESLGIGLNVRSVEKHSKKSESDEWQSFLFQFHLSFKIAEAFHEASGEHMPHSEPTVCDSGDAGTRQCVIWLQQVPFSSSTLWGAHEHSITSTGRRQEAAPCAYLFLPIQSFGMAGICDYGA